MDPLSLTASIVAVTTVAVQVGKMLAKIHDDWDSLPGRIHALNNEVQDFNIVLHQVTIAVEERKLTRWDSHGESNLPTVLARGELVLLDVKAILDKIVLAGSGVKTRVAIQRLLIWRREQGNVACLQDAIKQVKSSLNIILGASNSRDMIHVRLQLEQLTLQISDSTSVAAKEPSVPSSFIHNLLTQNNAIVEDSINQKYLQVDERLDRVEALIRAQSAEMHASQVSHIGPLYSSVGPPAKQNRVRAVSPASVARIRSSSTSVRIRLRQAHETCQSSCICSCHVVSNSESPSLLDRMLGKMFITFSGLPFLSSKCDSETCARKQIPTANVEYWFPLGFCWSQIVRFHIAYDANTGPSLQLSTLRQVPDSSQCVSFALNGNIDGLKNLFRQGLASPRDVSSTRGYSLLRWALYGQQYETCKFLMVAGADPTYRPIAQSDDAPSDKAGDVVLRGNISREVIEILRIISDGSDYVERQNFTRLHRIVLGLCSGDLETEVLQNPHDVDFPDAMGRTALQWAAARGDERAVVTLLSWGADPNNMDKKLNTPLTLAANQNQAVCVRLLLEAGALPDPELPPGIKFGTPLNCAARNATDPMVMKTLLDFNANIDASGVDGVTPLLHVARANSVAHAVLLLEYGANINAISKSMQTPLTAAIQYNNHSVLKLLLERWSDYQVCPRLKGPNLLEIVAQYADVETMLLLTAAEYLRTRTDSLYLRDHYFQVLEERNDKCEKLDVAFGELLSVIRMDAECHGGPQGRLEAGLNRWDCYTYEEDSGSDTSVFEDAKEAF